MRDSTFGGRPLKVGLLAATILLPTPNAKAQTFAYVGNLFDETVSVIDRVTDTVVNTIAVGGAPSWIAITPDGRFAYVSVGENVSVIDLATHTASDLPMPQGWFAGRIAFTPSGTHAYVTATDFFGMHALWIIDLRSNTVLPTPIAFPFNDGPSGLAMTPDGTRAYVTRSASDVVSMIDIATNMISGLPIPVGDTPFYLAITPDGTKAYVSNLRDDTVSVIDLTTNTVQGAPIPVGNGPSEIVITPDGSRAYVTNIRTPWDISVIDVATDTTVGPKIPIGSFSRGIAVTPDGTEAYVPNYPNDTVTVIDLATNTVVGAPIPVGDGPVEIAIAPTRAVRIRIPSGRISRSSQGLIREVVLTDEDFDAVAQIRPENVSSIVSGPWDASPVHGGHIGDVDDDGDLDVLLHFSVTDTGLSTNDSETCVTGSTIDGTEFHGCATIDMVP